MAKKAAKVLTVLAVKGAKGNSSGERVELPDGALPGLYLVVQPSGSKSWALRYRVTGKSKKLTLGPALVERSEPIVGEPPLGSAMTLPEARAVARLALQTLAEGRDPAETKRVQVEAIASAGKIDNDFLVEVLAAKFIQRYAKPKNKSWAETQRQFRKEIGFVDEDGTVYKGTWFGRDVRDLRKADFVKLFDKIVDRGSPVTANRVFATLSTWFAWMVGRDILKSSPMIGLKKITIESSRDRVLTDEELRIFWQATASFAYPFGGMWRLLLLTAQRRQEVAGLEWKELSLSDNPQWNLPKARSKNGRENNIPLSPRAVEILSAIDRTAKTSHVFTTTGDTAVSGFSRSKARLDKAMLVIMQKEAEERGEDPKTVSLEQWGLHDLRRTAASGMARLGQPIHVVEAVLNHAGGSISGVAAVYQRYDFAAEKRTALEAWANFVLNLGVEEDSNVISFETVAASKKSV